MVDYKKLAKYIYNVSFDALFTYSTVRLAKIHSVKIALIFRILQVMILGFIMFDLNNLIPSTSLFLKKSKLILLLPNKLILCLNLLIHLMFKFIQMCYLFHINFVLLRKLFINGCLAILYDN